MGAAATSRDFDARRRLVGTRLGRYQIGPRIGVGGSAAVYLARLVGPMRFERLVALKVVHEHLSEEKEFITQFLDEANLLVRFAHPNIVQVHELGREGDTLFLAMEYLHGQPLSRVVHALGRHEQRLPPELVAWMGARVAEGLGYAHGLTDERGQSLELVHRDVSPQNVFLSYDGQVKLIDFGIARAAGRIAQTTLGRVKGKFSYMAPEQVLGRNFDHRADQFALGVTLYEAAVGARLFTGGDEAETLQKVLFEEIPDPRTRVSGFPEALARVLLRMLSNRVDDRYPDALAAAQDLDAFVKESGVRDPAHRLAQLLAGHFEVERAEQQTAIDDLRQATSGVPTLPAPPDVAEERVSAVRPASSPPRRRRLALAVAGVAVLGAALAFALGRGGGAPVPQTTEPASVTLDVSTQPDVESEIVVAGQKVLARPARVTRSRGESAVEISIRAVGFDPATIQVIPDRDRSVVIPLVKTVPKPAPPTASSADASAKPATSARPGTKPVPGVAGTVKKKDPLVTKYPF